MVVHLNSHKVPRAPWYSGTPPAQIFFVYATLTLFGQLSQIVQLKIFRFTRLHYPESPETLGLGSSPFARRYLGNLG